MNNDLISREDLKKAIQDHFDNLQAYFSSAFIKEIDNAPTVEYTFEETFQKTVCENRLYCPARPKGEWIEDNGDLRCPFCKVLRDSIHGSFCPNCGADMKGGDEHAID